MKSSPSTKDTILKAEEKHDWYLEIFLGGTNIVWIIHGRHFVIHKDDVLGGFRKVVLVSLKSQH